MNYINLKYRSLLLCIIAGLFFVSCRDGNNNQSREEVSIVVYAASSMTDVLTEISLLYTKLNKSNVQFNFASSGTLARQITQGGEADVFISANEEWVNYLDSLNYTREHYPRLVSNRLVLVAPKNNNLNEIEFINKEILDSIIGSDRLVLSNPSHVPAGKYTAQALSKMGFTLSEDRILKTKDVRAALRLIELGEFSAGIVYKTDAIRSKKVDILYVFPENAHDSIEYKIVRCSESIAAKDFIEFLNSEKVKLIWDKYGFNK